VDAGGIDLVVTPGLAFDGAGGRLGRGGGFYDRFLIRARPAAFAAGFALREQVVGEVPAEATDARVDAVVTPERTMRPRATDGGG
jgi:5-formyltetrahydrofolate cyclo-ligase